VTDRVRVAAVETVPVSVPVETGLATAEGDAGAGETYERLLVRLELADGTDGWGEVAPYPSWPGSGTFADARAALDDLAAALRGREVSLVADAVDTLAAVADAPFALAGVDVALHDALARRRGIPVYDLLGGKRTDTLALHHTLGLKSPEAVAEEARTAAGRGFREFKLKVGDDLDADCRRASALVDAVPNARLRVDANGAWSPSAAIGALDRLDSAADGLAFVEQPVPSDDVTGMARVRDAVAADVVADEACADADDVGRLADAGAVDGMNVKIANAGGLVGARAAARVAADRDLEVLLGGMLELGVGAAASAHLGAAVAPTYPTGVFTRFAADLLVTDEARWSPAGPTLAVPDEPGLGVTVDRDALERYRLP
jgi:L-alanine-DL-glutamate epimerase-like enolase superfamily enzyme